MTTPVTEQAPASAQSPSTSKTGREAASTTASTAASTVSRPQAASTPWISPAVDVYESEDEILLVSDFPGVTPEDLTVRLEGSELLVKGAQQAREFENPSPKRFSRTFRLPENVDRTRITAKLDRGVLQLHLPKSEATKARSIPVTTVH